MRLIGAAAIIALATALQALASLAIVPQAAASAQGVSRPPLFGTVEVRNDNLTPFPKWTGMLERLFAKQGTIDGSCTATTFNKCHQERWQALLDAERGKPLLEQLQAVNRFMNETRYIVDPINWGVRDYWATPRQFFSKNGDCEDYAIAKYVTMKQLGVPARDMRIVVLQDLNLSVAHAVLAVFVEGRVMIMDNQIKQVVNDRTIRHYRPIFSINEEAWWLHRPPGGQRKRAGKSG